MKDPGLYATPLAAFKLARLTKVDGRVRLAPLNLRSNGPHFYENPGEAVCGEGHTHVPPRLECTCGFYAVGGREDLWRLGWHTLETAPLQVLLHGRIVEHRHGYRAQRQDVTSVELPGRCWWCVDPSEVLGRRRNRQRFLAPSCRRCARYDVVEPETLAEDLGCEVSFVVDAEDKASTRIENRARLVQTAPALLLAGVTVALSVLTGQGTVAGVGGLLAGGWLVPGRLLAESALTRSGLSPREVHRVLCRTGGSALVTAIGGWAAAGLIAMANTGL